MIKASQVLVALPIYLVQFIHVKGKYTIPNTAYCNIISFETNSYLTTVVSHLCCVGKTVLACYQGVSVSTAVRGTFARL